RDIAPDNIIVRADGSPVLLDFGAARQAVADMSRRMTGIVKAGYSPHEQYSSASRLQGPWSDLYALGATLYLAVTGSAPEEATLRADRDHMPSALQAAWSDRYRQSFLVAIDACLKVRYTERPQSVAKIRPKLLDKSTPTGRAAKPLHLARPVHPPADQELDGNGRRDRRDARRSPWRLSFHAVQRCRRGSSRGKRSSTPGRGDGGGGTGATRPTAPARCQSGAGRRGSSPTGRGKPPGAVGSHPEKGRGGGGRQGSVGSSEEKSSRGQARGGGSLPRSARKPRPFAWPKQPDRGRKLTALLPKTLSAE